MLNLGYSDSTIDKVGDMFESKPEEERRQIRAIQLKHLESKPTEEEFLAAARELAK